MAGAVGIDTGRLLLIDPGYVSELPDAGPYAAYGITVEAAPGTGVSTCPVRVLRARDGSIAAVRVDFVPDACQLPASGRRAMPASRPRRRAAPLNAQRV